MSEPSATVSVAFHEIARRCARVVGSPWASFTAVAAVVVWTLSASSSGA